VVDSRPVIEPKSNASRTVSGPVRARSGHRPASVRQGLSFGGPAAGFLLENHRIEHLLDDLLGLRVEAGDGLELESEGFIRPAFILPKEQLIGRNAQRHGQVADDIEGANL
jgi:hypothetical protein